jgi:hypothetical protein
MLYEAPLNFVPYVLEMSSCLHVTFLVFLRLIAIKFPLSYQTSNRKLRRITIIVIWTISILAQSIPLAIMYSRPKEDYFLARLSILHLFGSFPVGCIVGMNLLLLWIIKRKPKLRSHQMTSEIMNNSELPISEALSKKMTMLVQKVVTFLLSCYIPYLAWAHYFYQVIIQRDNPQVSEIEVNIKLY